MSVISLIPEKMYTLIVSLYILGIIFKNSKLISDEFIPLTLLPISVILSVYMLGLSSDSFIQAILCTGVAIGINQSFKQLTKYRNKGE